MRCRKKIPLVKAIQVSINILGIALCTQHNYWYIQQNNAIPIFPFRKADTDGPIRKLHTNFWYCPFNFIYLYMLLFLIYAIMLIRMGQSVSLIQMGQSGSDLRIGPPISVLRNNKIEKTLFCGMYIQLY